MPRKHSVPQYRSGNKQRKLRKCLVCGEMFNSEGPERRICGKHKSRRRRSKYDDWFDEIEPLD